VRVDSDEHVQAVALDDFATATLPPRLIKVDAEGGEEHVLAGARRLLESSGAPTVIVELHDAQSEGPLAILQACGYLVEDIAPGRHPRHLIATPRVRTDMRPA
jgi:hypothetical protein